MVVLLTDTHIYCAEYFRPSFSCSIFATVALSEKI